MQQLRIVSATFALAVFAAANCAAGEPPLRNDAQSSVTITLSDETRATDCYATLRDSQFFALGRVGYGGLYPEEIKAVNALLEQPDADAAFKSLSLPANSSETRLWALSGLYFTDAKAFSTGVEELRRSGVSVEVMSGCIVGKESLSDLVWSKSLDVFVVADRSKAVEEYQSSQGAGILDIAHGGIPAAIRHMKQENQTPCATNSLSSSLPQQ